MSGAASISGLASGLDTATIISQLMQLEAVPQSRLQTRVSSEQRAVTAMQTLNAKVASLATRAAELLKPEAWTALKVTSSNDKVSVATTSSAAPSSFSVRIDQTALTHRLEHTTATGLDTAATVPPTVRLDRLDGTTPVDLTTDGTLSGLVTAINDPANATGLRATAVRVGPDSYRLLVESTETGVATDFTLAATDGSPVLGGATVRAGRDAQVTLGDTMTATSTTNTFEELVPGISLTLSPDATGTTEISVTRDPSTTVDKVKTLVDLVNSVLTEIDGLTKSDPTTKTKGLLAGDAGVATLRTQLLQTVFPSDGTSLSTLGIQTDRSGKLVLDTAKLSEALKADPAAVQAGLGTGGFATRLEAAAKQASDKTNGTLTTAISGRNDSITRLNTDIDSWDVRLELRRTALTRQFTALETALSQMNSQATWLAGQISSLPTGSSGS